MKRILLVNDIACGGGVEKLMMDFVNAWHDKYELTVLLLDQEKKEYNDGTFPENVRVIIQDQLSDSRNPLKWGYIKFVRHYKNKFIKDSINNSNYDLVIAMKDGWVSKYVAETAVDTKIMWHHTDYNSYYYTYDIFGGPKTEFEFLKRYQYVVCVSEDVKNGIKDIIGDTGNLVVKYNPLKWEEIIEKAKEPVVDVVKEDGKTYFTVVGRINYQKGYDLLLEAAHMLEIDGYNFEVWVVGGTESWSDEQYRLERSVKRLGIKSVKFLGVRKNPYKYMKYADWVLSSSIFEGFSFVSQEAAILDKPMLLTDCGGVRELLGDNEYGLVMEKSVIGIYQGMKKVLDNPGLLEGYTKKICERKSIINYDDRMAEIEKIL
ncbi:glycosyltransferase [Butyrivibrio sp. XPD2006]|uniref:glycosyltransferase n=1 Tax=Butyrivibrio sp. XPD2006 TaxID=1280668 RepID=UPI0003B7BA61|nr:glycosyltransferase [Butyrivibrio sp. XPD2006]